MYMGGKVELSRAAVESHQRIVTHRCCNLECVLWLVAVEASLWDIPAGRVREIRVIAECTWINYSIRGWAQYVMDDGWS
jgi:hypothetical protein